MPTKILNQQKQTNGYTKLDKMFKIKLNIEE